jgi:hypothetical protein
LWDQFIVVDGADFVNPGKRHAGDSFVHILVAICQNVCYNEQNQTFGGIAYDEETAGPVVCCMPDHELCLRPGNRHP